MNVIDILNEISMFKKHMEKIHFHKFLTAFLRINNLL